MVSTGGGSDFVCGLGVVSEDNTGSLFIGVVGRVVTNLRSYGDSIGLGFVGSGFGSARNICLRRSSVQYRSNGVARRGSSSLLATAASSTQTAS